MKRVWLSSVGSAEQYSKCRLKDVTMSLTFTVPSTLIIWIFNNISCVFSSRTSLMLAAANGYTESVSLLISQGCNVLAHDIFHRTALHGAVSFI